MSTVPTRILEAVMTQLGAATAFAGWPVERGRIGAVEVETMPALVVTTGAVALASVFTGRREITMDVTVEGFRAAAAGETDAELEDALLGVGGDIVAAIEGDPTLGGVADDAEPGTVEVAMQDGAPRVGVVAVTVTISSGHLPGDMTTRA